MEELKMVLAQGISGLTFLLVAASLGVLTYQLRKRAQGLENADAREMVLQVLQRAEYLASIVVAELQQSVVDGLKEASADGKLDFEDVKRIQNRAMLKLKGLMNSNILDSLKLIVGDVDSFLRGLLEKQVVELKKNAGTMIVLPEMMPMIGTVAWKENPGIGLEMDKEEERDSLEEKMEGVTG